MSFFSLKKNSQDNDTFQEPTPDQDIPLTSSGHVDVDEILRQHKIIDRAIADGEAEEPASPLTQRVASERALDDLMNRYVNRSRDNCATSVNNLDTAFAQAKREADAALDKVELACVAVQTHSLLESADATVLDTYRKEFNDAQKTFEAFRARYHLVRPAKETSRVAVWIGYIVLFLFICIEGGINAALFGANLDGGLLAGFLTAFGASALNVGFAALVGYFLTRYLLVPGAKRLIGVVGLLFNTVSILGLSLAIAHYRDALQIDEENATQVAFQSLLADPFSMSDLTAWALFAISLAFGVAAVYDVWHLKDPFPGYHKANQTYKDALYVWTQVCEEFMEKLIERKDDFVATFDENLKKANLDVVHMERRLNDKRAELVKYERVANNAATALRSLIGKYREANRATRTTPPPVYFNSYDDVDYPHLDTIASKDINEQMAELQMVKDHIQALRSQANARKADVLRRFNDEKAILLSQEGERRAL